MIHLSSRLSKMKEDLLMSSMLILTGSGCGHGNGNAI